MTSETRYAKSDDVNIAYPIEGDGPCDLILVPGWASNADAIVDEIEELLTGAPRTGAGSNPRDDLVRRYRWLDRKGGSTW
jgi:hypothetical protein